MATSLRRENLVGFQLLIYIVCETLDISLHFSKLHILKR